jgi:hypothetical protein
MVGAGRRNAEAFGRVARERDRRIGNRDDLAALVALESRQVSEARRRRRARRRGSRART